MPGRLPIAPYEIGGALTPANKVDELVFSALRGSGYNPAPLCSDAVFVRRAYLDVIGTLPTPQETDSFLRNPAADKRAALIDGLLERTEFADYWSLRWGDVLRIKSEFSINLWPMAAQAYRHWVRDAIRQNMPYDVFARTLLTASGSNFREPQVNFYRAVQSKTPEGIASAVALTFMGARAENWPKPRLANMSAFFSTVGYKSTLEWKEEVVDFDPTKMTAWASTGNTTTGILPGGDTADLSASRDPREVFADWLITPTNPWFSKCAVNRIWYWLMGRGMIEEADDIRPDNPPQNPSLLAALCDDFVASSYDVKAMYRLILNSKTYQLSAIPATPGRSGEAVFANAVVQRLGAEVLIDAIDQITDSTEQYSSETPEPYTFIPDENRTIQLADGSITSSYLELFGRPARDTGLASERVNRMNSRQCLHLLNSSHIQRKIGQSQQLRAIYNSKMSVPDMVDSLYMLILSRHATDAETTVAAAYFQKEGPGAAAGVLDTAWALINGAEFLYRH
jgi:hypothetical protein